MTIQQLLQYVVDKKCSDLHLMTGSAPVIRIDGELRNLPEQGVLSNIEVEQLLAGVMTVEQKQVVSVNKEIDFSFQLVGKARFRVNVYYQKGTMAGSFRLIPMEIPTMDEIGLPKVMQDVVNLKQGFVLVTGPTGQGKSTTLASILDKINQTRPVHIITIEDPIEYVYVGDKSIVSQREIHNDTHSWEIALRSILREDPDVVLIGEMRDYETMASALTIAETGHLVFATLHTNSAAQTVDRIVDVFPENQQPQVRLQLSENLEIVFSQRLVPKIGGGRVVAYEVMTGTSAVKTAIRDAKTHMLDNIIMTSSEYGMSTLESSLSTLVKSGAISEHTAEMYAFRPNNMTRLMNGRGV